MSKLSYWIHTIRLFFRKSNLIHKDGRYIIINFYDYGNCFMASASTSDCSVWNCYGTTKKAAEEMALFRLNQMLNEDLKEEELGVNLERDGFTFFCEKNKAPLD